MLGCRSEVLNSSLGKAAALGCSLMPPEGAIFLPIHYSLPTQASPSMLPASCPALTERRTARLFSQSGASGHTTPSNLIVLDRSSDTPPGNFYDEKIG